MTGFAAGDCNMNPLDRIVKKFIVPVWKINVSIKSGYKATMIVSSDGGTRVACQLQI